ncbi:cobyrinate a,c-diamide synthase [Aestuariispira ectoiniformans]|uniref:cobyrinate a,c-diamide synthase n=1 Tax=Aestuariispira ectoiniformans TaxID=2775080 RepID=UPI00223B7F79|nr:cobyrinate a,c-diamide synthase [Aestuariispira ectoiniformans]
MSGAAKTAPGLIIAAPSSNSGKTLVTLAMLRALHRAGTKIASAKVGPDYIDPAFHSAASARSCLNLDPWAMRPQTIGSHVEALSQDADMILAEGVMGLFDGARDGSGSTADLAALTGWPVVLVVDVKGQSATAAAVVKGLASLRADIRIAGVLFNRVGSPAHTEMLNMAMQAHVPEVPVLGCLPRVAGLVMPERHLGLVQAGENADLNAFLNKAADWVSECVDLSGLTGLASASSVAATSDDFSIPPLGQHIAMARDDAYAFSYNGVLNGWRRAGAEISFFSPLADEAPAAAADSVYLPGGYPELHAGKLAANTVFMGGLRAAAEKGAFVFGECGGYMTLGQGLEDADGVRHKMAGLLPLETSFKKRRLHLGYRRAISLCDTVLGASGLQLRGHEFHYATVAEEGDAPRLFQVTDAVGGRQENIGLAVGSVAGSFLHLIDRA